MCYQLKDDIPLYILTCFFSLDQKAYVDPPIMSHSMRVGKTMQRVGWCAVLSGGLDYLHIALS